MPLFFFIPSNKKEKYFNLKIFGQDVLLYSNKFPVFAKKKTTLWNKRKFGMNKKFNRYCQNCPFT